MPTTLELFGINNYQCARLKSTLEQGMQLTGLDYQIEFVSEIQRFMDEKLEQIPAIRVDGKATFNSTQVDNPQMEVQSVISYIALRKMQTILVPVDFTANAANAAEYAHGLATDMHLRVVLLHVVRPLLYQTPKDTDRKCADVKQQLQTIARDLEQKSQGRYGYYLPVEAQVVTGLPPYSITHQARKCRPTMVVMSATGAQNIMDKFLGTVAAYVATHSECPVLLVPPKTKYVRPKSILVGVHAALTSNGSINSLMKFNQEFNAHLDFVNVLNKELNSKSEDHILVDRLLGGKEPTFSFDIHYLGSAANQIFRTLVDYAREQHTDLIVLTSRHRSPLQHLFRRSLSKQAAMRPEAPLLVLHE